MSNELKDKFARIYKKSKRINLKKVDLVYESVKKQYKDTKKSSTLAEISDDTKLSKNSVRNYLRHLEESHYVKKAKKYTPPFIKVTDKKDEAVEFIYSKENRNDKIEEEVRKIISLIKSPNLNLPRSLNSSLSLIESSKDYNYRFLMEYNKLIDYLWNNLSSDDFYKLEIGSGANRYTI